MTDRTVRLAEESAYYTRQHAFRNALRRRQLDLGRRGARTREASGASVGYVGRERAVSYSFYIQYKADNQDNAQANRDAADRVPAVSHMTPGSGLDTPLYAILHWYAQKVVTYLVQPGMYRPGRGGQSDAEWGPRAIVRNEFERTGLGVVYPSSVYDPAERQRTVHMEQHDPFYIGAKHARGPSTRFFRVLVGLVNHLNLPINIIIAAVWYVSRLSLHEGDARGSELRTLLNASARGSRSESVELRVAFLGLCLANRYIEDDSWAIKHYSEQLGIPVAELAQLEFAAVKDMLFSLKFDHEEWQEHLKESMHDIVAPAPIVFHLDQQNLYTLDAALAESKRGEEARRIARLVPVEVRVPRTLAVPPGFEPRPSSEFAIDDDDEDEYCEYDGAKPFITRADLRRASASQTPPEVTIDEEDEYCEYDGAKPFITNADLRRASNSQRSPMQSWLAGVSENTWQAVPVDAPARLGRVRSRSFLRRNEPVAVADDDYGMDEQDAEDVYRSLAPHYPSSVETASVGMRPSASSESLQTIDSSEALGARTPEFFDAQEPSVPMAQEESGNISIDHVEAITVPADNAWVELEPGVRAIAHHPVATASANSRWSSGNYPAYSHHHQYFPTVKPWSFA